MFGKFSIFFLLVVALLFVNSVVAQEDIKPFFGQVKPERVTVASAVIGTDYNQREYEGQPAQDLAQLVKQYSGRFTPYDRIQPFTWDFENWTPLDYTPLVLMVSVREQWDAWEDRRGEAVSIHYMHRTSLSCYDVGDPDVYDCRQYQGSVYYELSYHVNSISVSRADVLRLITDLGM